MYAKIPWLDSLGRLVFVCLGEMVGYLVTLNAVFIILNFSGMWLIFLCYY